MVYSGGFVICVLVNDEVQQERADGIVIIPEGTEYSIRLRNKNNRRAVGQIFIDNENVSGGGYIVNSHSYVDIKRFSHKDEAFKAVGLNSSEAVDYGKNGPNDGTKGVIEVRFRLEREVQPKACPLVYVHQHTNKRGGPYKKFTPAGPGGQSRLLSLSKEGSNAPLFASSYNSTTQESKFDDAVTVGGGSTGQTFYSVHFDAELQETILKIVLKVGEPVIKVNYCTNCGAKPSSKKAKFCHNCGDRI